MSAQRFKPFFQIAVWLITEIILNLTGLDNLADRSEFIFGRSQRIERHPVHEFVLMIASFDCGQSVHPVRCRIASTQKDEPVYFSYS